MFLRFFYVLLIIFSIISSSTTAQEAKNMTLTINIYYTGTNGNARKFAEEMESSGIAEAIRQKSGNLRYEYFYPAQDNETVLLIDAWDNQEALDKHHASEIMQRILELRNKYDLHMRVERYVSEGDIPAFDAKFVRE